MSNATQNESNIEHHGTDSLSSRTIAAILRDLRSHPVSGESPPEGSAGREVRVRFVMPVVDNDGARSRSSCSLR